MYPFLNYALPALLLMLGLAAFGGAAFGQQRNRRVGLAVLGIVFCLLAALIYLGAPRPERKASTPTETPVEPTEIPATAAPTATPVTVTATFTPTLPALGNGVLAFHSDRDGEIDIYTMALDGSNLQRLTTDEGRDFEPDWSPDGSTLVFSSDRDDPENAHLYLMNADGSNQRLLDTGLTDDQVGARWSPDGQYLLFHSNPLVDGLPRFDVFRVRADGSELTNLTNTPGNNFMADWSPDGARIVFVSQRNGNSELYVMNADGSNQIRLTESQSENLLPRWSPDGSQIMFESSRSGPTYSLYSVPAPGDRQDTATAEADVRQLTPPGHNSGTVNWVNKDWVLFSSDRDSTNIINWELYLMREDASEIYRLTDDADMDRFPSWSN